MLKPGTIAPEFTLNDQFGNPVSLADFRGKTVVLYFYSKDNTSGCTAEGLGFQARIAEFESKNAVVLGVSKDSVASHEKFAARQGFSFRLLSDPDRFVIGLYDALNPKTMYGKPVIGTSRLTYVIDADGKITSVYRDIKANEHAERVLAEL